MFSHSVPIWLDHKQRTDEYVETQECFIVADAGERVLLTIAAESDYNVYLNGHLAAFGQFAGFPRRKLYYDVIDVTDQVVSGENSLVILAWYDGNPSSVCAPGVPFLRYEWTQAGNCLCASGEGTKIRRSSLYLSHRNRLISGQLGPAYACDFTACTFPFERAVKVELQMGCTAY